MLNVDLWNRQIGLLPVNFLHMQREDQGIYAMLNGASHNFCIGSDDAVMASASFRDKVWSANMTSYMSVSDDVVRLYDLYRTECETIEVSTIERDVFRFYSYLSTKTLRREDGVLELILSQFKAIRSMLREEEGARQSLSVLLKILSRLDGAENIDWRLPDNVDEAIRVFSIAHMDAITRQLKDGLQGLKVRPNTDMILRHCSGALFQEANFIAHFPPQLSLFPTVDYSSEKNPNLIGAYFTPSYIARTIVEESLKRVDLTKDILTIFDPACGSGVFLSECLRQLKTLKYRGRLIVIGWDIDQIAIDMSNYVLSFEKQEWGDRLVYKIENHNSIEPGNQWPMSDLILMNPPYISWALMSDEQRQQSSGILGRVGYRSNLSVVFYYLASRSLNGNGVIGSLMPSAFLQSDKVSEIRQQINETVPPVLIAQLGSYVFSSAFVDVSIIVAQRRDLNGRTQFVWTRNNNRVSEDALRALRRVNAVARPIESSEDYNIYAENTTELLERDIWTPLSRESIGRLCRLTRSMQDGWLCPVKSLFDVKQGARTGANRVFVLPQREYENLPKREREYFRPSIDNDAINYGKLEIVNYIFYPYPTEEKGFANEEDLAQRMPTYYQRWLLPNKNMLQNRSHIDTEKWWLLTRPRPWQFGEIYKLVSTEFGKAGSFSIDYKGNFVVERGMCWVPFDKEMDIREMYFYLAILNSDYFNKLLMIYSKQLAGGVFNLEAKHVNEIPLPVYRNVSENERDILSRYGKSIALGARYDETLYNDLVRRVYGE